MQSNSPLTEPSQSRISEDHLYSYHYFNAFDLFLFSKSSLSKPLFLLHKPLNSSQFTHFSGQFTKHDPTIYFSIAREFLNYTKGFLHSQNFPFFLSESPTPLPDEKSQLYLEEDITKPSRPQKFFSKGVDDICRLLAESPFLYQDSRGIANYFIEFPLLNTELINKTTKEMGITMEIKYFSLEEILDKANAEISQSLRTCLENSGLLRYMEKYIIKGEAIEIEENYAVLSCNAARRDSLIPALNYCTHKKHGEKWRFYRAYDFDFPTDEELKKLKGILIPGSGHSAYWDHVEWYPGLFECLKKIVYEHKHINLLCICFGAQAIAQALGGKVVKMDRSFNRGGDLMTVQEAFYELEYVKGLGLDQKKGFLIGKAHGDHILELPEGAVLQGSSNVANVELFTIGNNVLAMQGHPEFNEAWVAGAHYRFSKQDLEDYEEYQEKYIQEKFPSPITQEELLKVCYTFLKKKNNSF